MFSARGGRTVAVFAGSRGAGATTCVLNVAAAVAQQGRRVLAIDENGERNIPQLLGLRARNDLRELIEGRCGLADVLLHTPAGLTVIAAAQAGRAVLHNDPRVKESALKTLEKLANAADVVLVDARSTAEPSAFAAAADDVVIVVSTSATSITGGYTALKRMSRTQGRKRFHLLVNRVDEEGVAQRVRSNMADAASKHLGLELDYLGAVPRDVAVVRSALHFSSPLRRSALTGASQHFRTHAATIRESSAAQDCFTRLDNFMQRAIYGNFAVGAGV